MTTIALLATLDTKLTEARFVADRIREFGGTPFIVNLGTDDVAGAGADVLQQDIRRRAEARDVIGDSEKVRIMQRTVSGATAILSEAIANGEIDGALAIGGGQGSWLASAILRTLPVGFPRMLVSTAGRDVGQYTQFSDIVAVFSITDVAGTNPLLRRVLTNAAAAICGMSQSTAWREPLPDDLVAVTVYGITTAGATVAMDELRAAGIEPVSFHANGVGGPTLEAQLAAGTFRAVLDWSITEVADEVVGGICTAGPDRLTNAPRLGLPQVVVPGGIDVVNFAARSTVPDRFDGRTMYQHTPDATLLRTDVAENREIAALVASRLNATTAPVRVIIPLGGFSALSATGGPIADPAADRAFADSLAEHIDNELVTIETRDEAINDPAFARHAARAFVELLQPSLN